MIDSDEKQKKFIMWLNGKNIKPYSPDYCIDCITSVSVYAVAHHISNVNLWEIDDSKKLNKIRNIMQGNRLYKLSHPVFYRAFNVIGKFYSDFLATYNDVTASSTAALSDLNERQNISSFEYKISDLIKSREPSTAVALGESSAKSTASEKNISAVTLNDAEDSVKNENLPEKAVSSQIETSVEIGRQFKTEVLPEKEETFESAYTLKDEVSSENANLDKNLEVSSPLQDDEKLNDATSNDKELVISFFANDIEAADLFMRLYDYQKQTCPDIVIEVRDSIIGLKVVGERLRFYVTHNNFIFFTRYKPDGDRYIRRFTEDRYQDFIVAIDASNEYFRTNKRDVKLKVFINVTRKKDSNSKANNSEESTSKNLAVDFSQRSDYSYTSPVSITWFGEKHGNLINWRDAYVFICQKLCELEPEKMNSLLDDNSLAGNKIACSVNPTDLHNPLKIKDRFYVEGCSSINYMVLKIGSLLCLCGVDYKNVLIEYAKKGNAAQSSIGISSEKEKIECPSEIMDLLERKFPFGIRMNSAIDIMKLKNYAEEFNISINDDAILKEQILAGGLSYNGKVYFFPSKVYQDLVDKIKALFDDGYSVIYYESFYSKNLVWLDENHISSSEMLPELLNRKMNDVHLGKNFLMKGKLNLTEIEAFEKELSNFWGESVTHTYEEIYKLIPYIPEEKIRLYLSRSDRFIWSSFETFAFIDRFIITEADRQAIYKYVDDKCNVVGYASLSDIPLASIQEVNYEMSINAIYEAVYNLALKRSFIKNGKILNKNKTNIDLVSLAKAYCSSKDECSFTDLSDYIITLNGTTNRQAAYTAAYETMVRVSEDKFVADKLVEFDVGAIDKLLEQYIVGDFLAIKGIATFALFPNCNYPWNHFVLESFCYKYSKKFSLRLKHFNEKNAGIIAKKGFALEYNEMAAIVAAKSGIELNEEAVGEYLCEMGYFAKNKVNIMRDIADRAKRIRKEV